MVSFTVSPLSRILGQTKQVVKPLIPSPNKKCDLFGEVTRVDLQSSVTLGSFGFIQLAYAPC